MPAARRSARAVSSSAAKDSASPYTRTNSQSSPGASRSSASIARPANGKTSLRLTVKAPPSKLRQATSGSSIPPNPYADDLSESDATPAPPTRIARTTRNPRTVVDPESDEEDEDAPGEEEDIEEEEDPNEDIGMDEEDADGPPENEMAGDDDSEDDAEGDDEDMADDHPPPPVIRQERAGGSAKPQVTVTAPPEGPLKSVEDKEMEDDDDDDELSELESGDGEGDEGEEDEDDDSDEDDENSRSATPDLSKLTRRQRGVYEEEPAASLMSLSNEAQKKKHLTAEEHAMRRAEMARRRKNLSEKRNEEEKASVMDTINKLLSKPAPKRRTRAEIEAAKAAGLFNEDDEDKPDALYVRWVNNREGSRIGVPAEWLDSPVGVQLRRAEGTMVEEVA